SEDHGCAEYVVAELGKSHPQSTLKLSFEFGELLLLRRISDRLADRRFPPFLHKGRPENCLRMTTQILNDQTKTDILGDKTQQVISRRSRNGRKAENDKKKRGECPVPDELPDLQFAFCNLHFAISFMYLSAHCKLQIANCKLQIHCFCASLGESSRKN